MSAEDNKRIAHLWYEVMWSKPDPDIADELVDPNYAPEWIHIDKKGPEQIKHEIKYFRSVFPDLKYEIVETAALPDRVWIRYKAKGTQQGPAWAFHQQERPLNLQELPSSTSRMAKSLIAGEHFPFTIF
jgi:SnoaL-like polyketide cyclase